MQCPKCAYEPTMAEMKSSPEQCPACGVYYAKVAEPAPTNAVSHAKQAVKFTDWLDSNPRMKIIGALVIGLLIGYFAGREHVKYEIKSAIQDTFKGFSGAFSGGQEKARSLKDNPAPKDAGPVRASFKGKDFSESSAGRDAVDISLVFINSGDKDIRAFDGKLQFTDLLGNEILESSVAINELVPAGKSLPWEGSINYNKYIDRHRNFRYAENSNIKMNFVIRKVLYSDGRLQEF